MTTVFDLLAFWFALSVPVSLLAAQLIAMVGEAYPQAE